MSRVTSLFPESRYSLHSNGGVQTLALILAGGRGSRLHELTDYCAKPAVPFGGKYKLVDFALSNCINSGICNIGVITQYKSHSLNQHIQHGWQLYHSGEAASLEMLPAQQQTEEQSWYTGTADAIYQNLDIIRSHNPKHVLILSGDHIYKMNYQAMIQRHNSTGAKVTVGTTNVPKMDATQFGVLTMDQNGFIDYFKEKPNLEELHKLDSDDISVSMGIYVFDTQFLYELLTKAHKGTKKEHDFGKDIIPGLISDRQVLGFSINDSNCSEKTYWRDVGTLDSYYKANMELIGVVPSLNLHDNDWPVRTYQNQLAPAKFVIDERGHSGNVFNSMISDGSIIIGSDIVNSMLSKSVQVGSGSIVEEAIVLPNVSIGKNCNLYKTIVDTGCTVPDGMTIGIDKEFSRKHFRITENGVTLVTQTMLDKITGVQRLAA